MPPKKKSNEDARARAQAKREALRKAERNRRLGFIGLWSTLGVVVVVLVVLFAVVLPKGTASATGNVNAPASAALTNDLASISEATFASVGTSGAGKTVDGLQTVSGGTPVETAGLPTLMYIGGEFCPYCASERWVLASALGRFGTFTGLQTTKSAGNDVYPNTATLTFLTTKYTSKYISFTPYEVVDRAHKTLQTASSEALASQAKYDSGGGVPFFSINNVYIGSTQYNPQLLAGKTADQIAAALTDPTTDIAKNALVAANIVTAGICGVTKQQPTAVCSTPEVTAAKAYLNSAGSSGTSSG